MTVAGADSQKQRGQTTYMILQEKPESQHLPGLREDDETVDVTAVTKKTVWAPVLLNVHANNADQAVRVYAEKLQKEGTPFTARVVAISEARWKPQKVTVEQTTVVKVGDA